MSILGDLFDPVGAVATGGNNGTFDSMFSPGDNLLGNNGLGLEPSWLGNFNQQVNDTQGNFADNVMNVNEDELRNLGNHFKSNPGQLFYAGADPLSTKLWNGVTNQNNTSFVNQYGGETNRDYQNSANRGINTQDGQYMGGLANMIAGGFAGSELGSLAGSAYGSATAGAGAQGSMGSSALDVQSELANPALAGSGGSASAYDAAQIPGWTAGAGAGGYSGGQTASGVARGAAQGGANALDNGNQNPWTATVRGALNGGIGSGMDYAGAAGIDNQYLKGAVNGGLVGGVRAGMQDTSNTGYGALVGALGGLANKAGSYFSQPSSGDGGQSTGTTNWGNLATTLGNLYMTHRNETGIQGQINSLNGLYQPGGAYATQMQQQLDRQDAAGGRRSQYGTRAVELQARLADAASRNAPTLSNLYGQQRMNRFNQFAGVLGGLQNSGAFGSLGSMFNNQQIPQQPIPSPIANVSNGDLEQYDPNDLRNNVNSVAPGYQIPGG